MRLKWRKNDSDDSGHLQEDEDVIFSIPDVEGEAKTSGSLDIDWQRYAFFGAIQGITLDQMMKTISDWFTGQKGIKDTATENRDKLAEAQIKELRIRIEEEKAKLDRVPEMEGELQEEKKQCELKIEKLSTEFQELTSSLGQANENLVKVRIEEAKSELNQIVDTYKKVFNHKLGDENNLKTAMNQHVTICDEMIKSSRNTKSILQEKLDFLYQLGTNKISTSFLIMVGFLSSIASGWFFTIFLSRNDITNENWLFFVLNNIFNFLIGFIKEEGPALAGIFLSITLVVLLIVITFFIWIIEGLLSKIADDKSTISLLLNIKPRSNNPIGLKVKANSTLAFWLRIVPWLLMIGILFIILALGQYLGSDSDQIHKLGANISGQFIGTIIALLSAGVALVYISQINKPSLLSKAINKDQNSIEEKPKLKRELKVAFIIGNSILVLVVLSQLFSSGIPHFSAFLSSIMFMLLVNLTAYTLSYGIGTKGVIRELLETESKILYLSELREAFSGSNPIQVWLEESEQFRDQFLIIQQELLLLIRTKNQSLNHLHNNRVRNWFSKLIRQNSHSFLTVGKLNLAKKDQAQFYLRNFPELSYQIEETRNKINSEKRTLEEIKKKLAELRDRYSDFHKEVKSELRRLNFKLQEKLNKQIKIQEDKLKYEQDFEERKLSIYQLLMEGYELGEWTRKHQGQMDNLNQ